MDRSAWLWATEGPQKEFASAYASFRQALEHSFPNPEAERAVGEAYAAYASAVQAPWQSGQHARRAAELEAAYAKSIRDALATGEARSRFDDAFQRYIVAARAAWTALDEAEIRPEDFLMIAQSIAWIASIAAEICREPASEG